MATQLVVQPKSVCFSPFHACLTVDLVHWSKILLFVHTNILDLSSNPIFQRNWNAHASKCTLLFFVYFFLSKKYFPQYFFTQKYIHLILLLSQSCIKVDTKTSSYGRVWYLSIWASIHNQIWKLPFCTVITYNGCNTLKGEL